MAKSHHFSNHARPRGTWQMRICSNFPHCTPVKICNFADGPHCCRVRAVVNNRVFYFLILFLFLIFSFFNVCTVYCSPQTDVYYWIQKTWRLYFYCREVSFMCCRCLCLRQYCLTARARHAEYKCRKSCLPNCARRISALDVCALNVNQALISAP